MGPKNILTTRFIKIIVSYSVSLSFLPVSNHILSINPKPSPRPKQTPKLSLQATQRQLLAASNILFSLSCSSCLFHLLVFFYANVCVMCVIALFEHKMLCMGLQGRPKTFWGLRRKLKMYVYVYVYECVYICVCVCVYVYVYVHVCLCLCLCSFMFM